MPIRYALLLACVICLAGYDESQAGCGQTSFYATVGGKRCLILAHEDCLNGCMAASPPCSPQRLSCVRRCNSPGVGIISSSCTGTGVTTTASRSVTTASNPQPKKTVRSGSGDNCMTDSYNGTHGGCHAPNATPNANSGAGITSAQKPSVAPSRIPRTNGTTACFGYNAAHVLVPVDCSTPGAQTLVPASPPSTPKPTATSPQDAIEQTTQSQQPQGAPGNSSPPSQQAAQGIPSGNVSLPLNTDQLAAKIEQCSTGKCSCSSFPISKVPVIDRTYPICDQRCGLDNQCFRDCSDSFNAYNKEANAYNQLSKKTCPRNYSDN
jgi:hypothetical protein